ncbi:MAG: hypothetical protein R3F11_26485 [Verrucomicrobiales bacterium]
MLLKALALYLPARHRFAVVRRDGDRCRLGFTKVKMLPFDNKSEFQIILNMPEGSARRANGNFRAARRDRRRRRRGAGGHRLPDLCGDRRAANFVWFRPPFHFSAWRTSPR